MAWAPIIKSRHDWKQIPNLQDYPAIRSTFSWDKARQELDGLPNQQGLNIAHEAIDRHASGPLAHHTALRWIGKNGKIEDYTYAQLQDLSISRR